MLSDKNIRDALLAGRLYIDPAPKVIQPASVDVHLSNSIFFPDGEKGTELWPRAGASARSYEMGEDGIVLEPGDFVLGSTVETVRIPLTMAVRFEGKSSLGRQGILTHVSAGFIDPGFYGQITVEIVNLSKRDLTITPGMPIGQLCFFRLETPASRAYGHSDLGSHYQGQTGATPCWEDAA